MQQERHIWRTRYDDDLGFVASEYKYRFHLVEGLVVTELNKLGYKVKKMRINERKYIRDYMSIEWRLKKARGQSNGGRGCCGWLY